MRNKLIYTLIFSCILLFTACYEQARDCETFKNGVFESQVTIDNVVYKSKFKRVNNLQVETYETITDSASVRWINPCEFILSTIKPKNKSEEKPVHIKILTTSEDAYTFEFNYVGETLKQTGVAKKIN